MRVVSFSLFAAFVSVVRGHFRLQFPTPRGPFVAANEPKFCGGYTETTTNRSTFPLSGGFVSVNTGHPSWVSAIIVSTVQNTISFDNFTSNGTQQLVKNFDKEANAGSFCLPIDFSLPKLPALKDGANVTIQVVVDGGDGTLYQCADLTLKKDFTIDSNNKCENVTSETSHTTSATSPASTGNYVAASVVLGSARAPSMLAVFAAIFMIIS